MDQYRQSALYNVGVDLPKTKANKAEIQVEIYCRILITNDIQGVSQTPIFHWLSSDLSQFEDIVSRENIFHPVKIRLM